MEFSKLKEQYERAIELKEEIKQLMDQRDYYDMLYETERFEQFILLNENEIHLEEDTATHFQLNPEPKMPIEEPQQIQEE